jgi:hypothetical protein
MPRAMLVPAPSTRRFCVAANIDCDKGHVSELRLLPWNNGPAYGFTCFRHVLKFEQRLTCGAESDDAEFVRWCQTTD